MLSVVYISIVLQMLLVWLIAKKINNPSVVDVAWPITLMISGFIYLYTPGFQFRNIIISLLLLCWGSRLALYLFFSRINKGIVDKRYLKLSISHLINFQLQGLFIFIMSIVFMFAASGSSNYFYILDYIGIALCLLGIIGETTADAQLQSFKKNNHGKVCNVGLWNYSRHPNYFFDWLTWCGFTCFALHATHGWIALCSPLLLFIIMTKITGPLTEKGSIESRGDIYLQYQRSTSMFFPWFKRK